MNRPALRLLPLALLAIVCFSALWWWARRSPVPMTPIVVPRSELELHDGLLCLRGRTSPFSGVMTETYPNGLPLSRSEIHAGRLHGISEGWHTNGQLQIREQFVRGLSEGERVKWYPDGTTQSVAAIVDGKLHGPFRRWHDNGQLAEELTLVEGQPHGLSRAWHPSGSLKAEVRLDHGQVIEQQFHADGEKPGSAVVATPTVSP